MIETQDIWTMINPSGTNADNADTDNYFLPSGYSIRAENAFFDDTKLKDEWQREVYLYASNVMKVEGLKTVCDLGCGSGFKLIEYLGDFDTIGIDLEPTVAFLRTHYPNRVWKEADLEATDVAPADVVICADVIEHVLDPDKMVRFIKRLAKKYAVISTPDRNLVYPDGSSFLRGPPRNECHVREWSFDEFARYLSQEFTIIDHHVSNALQGTQLALCVPR